MGIGRNEDDASSITSRPPTDAIGLAAEQLPSPLAHIDRSGKDPKETTIVRNDAAAIESATCPAVSSNAIPQFTPLIGDFAPEEKLISELLTTVEQPLGVDANAGLAAPAMNSAEREAAPSLPIGTQTGPGATTSRMHKSVTPLRPASDKRQGDGSSPVTIGDMLDFTPSPRRAPSAANNLRARTMQNQTAQPPWPFIRRIRSRSVAMEPLEQLSSGTKRAMISPQDEMLTAQKTASTALSLASISQSPDQPCSAPGPGLSNAFFSVKQSLSESLFSTPASATGSQSRTPLSMEDEPGPVRRGRGRPRKYPKAKAEPAAKRKRVPTPEQIEAMQAGRRRARELRQQAANSDTAQESLRSHEIAETTRREAHVPSQTENDQKQEHSMNAAASNEGSGGTFHDDAPKQVVPSQAEVGQQQEHSSDTVAFNEGSGGTFQDEAPKQVAPSQVEIDQQQEHSIAAVAGNEGSGGSFEDEAPKQLAPSQAQIDQQQEHSSATVASNEGFSGTFQHEAPKQVVPIQVGIDQQQEHSSTAVACNEGSGGTFQDEAPKEVVPSQAKNDQQQEQSDAAVASNEGSACTFQVEAPKQVKPSQAQNDQQQEHSSATLTSNEGSGGTFQDEAPKQVVPSQAKIDQQQEHSSATVASNEGSGGTSQDEAPKEVVPSQAEIDQLQKHSDAAVASDGDPGGTFQDIAPRQVVRYKLNGRKKRTEKASPVKKPKMTGSMRSKAIIEGLRRKRERKEMERLQQMQISGSAATASNKGHAGDREKDKCVQPEMMVNDVMACSEGPRQVVRYRLNARRRHADKGSSVKQTKVKEARQVYPTASGIIETQARSTSGSFLSLIASRRLRTPMMICEDEPITYESWKAKLKTWDPATATSSHTSSSSRAAPFPFEPPPVLYPELKPKGLDACADKNDIKLIGRRKPGNEPLPDLIYDITKVPNAAEDSIIFRTKSRKVWTALVPEMSILSAEAGWRNHHLLSKKDLHTYDSKPLRMDYIYDRMMCDDPIDGWQVRCRHSGQLQGFLTYTNFVTYQPMVFHGDPPDLIRKMNRSHRQSSYWFGCIWPEVVELVLLGALACGTLLMEEFLDSLVNTEVKFIIIHATVHARRYYEKLGFTRVKACARYDVKNRQLRTPTVTSAGYDGGYGFHMLLLQFVNDVLASVSINTGLHEVAARADRGFFSSIYQAWKALEAQVDRGHKMEARKIYDFYRNQYRVQEEFQVDVASPKYIQAFMRDPACYPYHHWQFKSVTSSELEDPSLLLVLELSEWTGRKITSKTCTQPVVEWKCPPLYRWVNPNPAKLTPRSLTYIPKGAPGELSRFTYWYLLELIPDLRWAHLVPMVQKGSFPVESARKGRPRYCLQPRHAHEREFSVSMDRLVPVPADCIRGKGSDPDQDLWDVKDFNPQDYEE